jgi:uncharacterized protein with HEPN domain
MLLKGTKTFLYRAADNEDSVHSAIKAVWKYFVAEMTLNHYLKEWHNGDAVSRNWAALGEQSQREL